MVEAAMAVFARRGFHGASMDEIAASAGISKPMLYAYFESKEGLFAACSRKAGEVLRDRMRAVVDADLPPDEAFYAGLMTMFDFVEEHREPWKVLYPQGGLLADPIMREAAESREAMVALLTELFSQVALGEGLGGEALSHAEPMARALTAATIAVAADWARREDEPKELAVLRLMNFAWMGFGDMLRGRLWLPGQGEV
jgi:AcrR family transcriptional regulator